MQTLSRPLKKGDDVIVFSSYDDKGTFAVTRYVVASAGKVQAHFIRTDGTNAEWRGHVGSINTSPGWVLMHASDVADVEAQALAFAAEYLVWQRARLADCIRRFGDVGGVGYIDAINKSIAALHEPRIRDGAEAPSSFDCDVVV